MSSRAPARRAPALCALTKIRSPTAPDTAGKSSWSAHEPRARHATRQGTTCMLHRAHLPHHAHQRSDTLPPLWAAQWHARTPSSLARTSLESSSYRNPTRNRPCALPCARTPRATVPVPTNLFAQHTPRHPDRSAPRGAVPQTQPCAAQSSLVQLDGRLVHASSSGEIGAARSLADGQFRGLVL